MQGKAVVRGHPLHPALVALPIGCFTAAVVGDVVSIWYQHAFFASVDTWLIGLGLLGMVPAATAGFIDFLSTPLTQAAKRVATRHAILNGFMFVIFGLALVTRAADAAAGFGYFLTGLGFATMCASGWLGGELVYRHLAGSIEHDVVQPRVALEDGDEPVHDKAYQLRHTVGHVAAISSQPEPSPQDW